MRDKLALLKTLSRIGWRRVLLVALHRRRMRSGYYERACPVGDWQGYDGEVRSPFVCPSIEPTTTLIADAERIVSGELRYFSWKWMPKPRTWRENPETGFETPLVHWSTLKDFDARQGDVKWIWEPSRFDWAVTLARAYAATKDKRYKDTFFDLLKDWRAHNPPNQGINWFCAQECSLRMLALIFAAPVFSDPSGSRDIQSTIAALAERVEPSIGYAIGQHNNHGISEATGLYLAGICLSAYPSSDRWRSKGKELLCRFILEQFAYDGSYVQHSFIYQRLAMRCCLAAFQAARAFGDSFPREVEDRVLDSGRFLYEMMVWHSPLAKGSEDGQESMLMGDSTSEHQGLTEPTGAGRLPNYGANDGANALSLSDCDYLDFRPIIQLAHALLDDSRVFGEGPWDEELQWFGIDRHKLEILEKTPSQHFIFPAGGYHVLRSPDGEPQAHTFIRVPHYRDARPGQADALHVDVWIDGEPVAVDSGTYSYNDAEGLWKAFKSTAAHNTLVVDALDQMPSAGRFLYTNWTRARLVTEEVERDPETGASSGHFAEGDLSVYLNFDDPHLCATYDAYASRGCKHYRMLQVIGGGVMVSDYLFAKGKHHVDLHWHLDGDWEPIPRGARRTHDGLEITVVRSREADSLKGPVDVEPMTVSLKSDARGQSLRYGDRSPVFVLTASIETVSPEILTTFIGLKFVEGEEDEEE